MIKTGYFKGIFLQYVLLTLVCFAFYGNTILNDYAYDDSIVITENQFTQKGVSGIPEIFANNSLRGSYGNNPTAPRYRPLSLASFAIEIQLFGQNPHVSHFINVLLLGLTSLVLYQLLSKVFGRQKPENGLLDFPLMAVLLFIAHPVHTEPIANIKGRDEILALLFSLSATLFVLKYLDTRRRRHLTWGALLFLAALFSKENAITFLAIVPLTIYYYRQEKPGTYVRCLMPLVVSTAVFLGIGRLAVGSGGPHPSDDIITEPFFYATLSERFATVFYTFGRYLKLLVFPHPLTIHYDAYHIQLANWKSPAVWFSILAYASAAFCAVRNLKKKSVISYGILFYLCTFSIVSNLPFTIGNFMSERSMFVPSLGFVVIVAWLLSTRVPAPSHKNAILVALLLLGLFKTHSRNQVWKNDFTLFIDKSSFSLISIFGGSQAFLSHGLHSCSILGVATAR